MPTKRTSENDLGVTSGAAAAAVTARRKPVTTARKKRTVSQAEPAAILTAPQRAKTVAAQPVAAASNAPTFEQIAQLAYTIWESRGCQGGSPEEDWHAAEEKLRAGRR